MHLWMASGDITLRFVFVAAIYDAKQCLWHVEGTSQRNLVITAIVTMGSQMFLIKSQETYTCSVKQLGMGPYTAAAAVND